ncbi:AAA family ATPase [Leptotrichia sp.]|uniref:AAA family ATPase n=1 Tax=Leptotrichia sp. TaxID=104608 RepID=UPI0017E1411D|nr:AAA family ATPase [Leptotrichia sp.]MBB1535002.1 AAA family ATPase [Leptotrichia sp.]
MSSLTEAKKLLQRYTLARIPFVSINTIERARTLDILKEVANDNGLLFLVHTLSKGIYDLVSNRTVSEDKSIYAAIDFVSDEMKRRENLTVIFTEVQDLTTDSTGTRQMLDLVTLANEHGGTIIVLTNNSIWGNLQRLGMTLKVDLPDESEMYEIIKEYIDDYRSQINIEWDDNDIKEVASTLTGVTKIEAENVIAALIANKEILKKDKEDIAFAKDRLFSDISGLEKITVDENVKHVGGLSGLRKWLAEKKELLKPEKREMLKAKGLQSPRGILLVGVPGCGKSLSAKSISANWKLPLYRLDFATVQGSYVGQTEQQLKDALTTAENVSPCILWIDEIEKGLSGANSTNDGGVSKRMVGQFLFWLQECKKQVFVVATANDVSMLPSELLRRGRFDELFFIDLPTAEERKEILSLYIRKYLNLKLNEKFSEKLVSLTEGFTGADLESAVRELAYRVIANENFELNEDNIVNIFVNIVPLSQTSPEKIESIREWGKERAVPASGKPIGEEELKKTSVNRTRKVIV